jgi:hypothetical protein
MSDDVPSTSSTTSTTTINEPTTPDNCTMENLIRLSQTDEQTYFMMHGTTVDADGSVELIFKRKIHVILAKNERRFMKQKSEEQLTDSDHVTIPSLRTTTTTEPSQSLPTTASEHLDFPKNPMDVTFDQLLQVCFDAMYPHTSDTLKTHLHQIAPRYVYKGNNNQQTMTDLPMFFFKVYLVPVNHRTSSVDQSSYNTPSIYTIHGQHYSFVLQWNISRSEPCTYPINDQLSNSEHTTTIRIDMDTPHVCCKKQNSENTMTTIDKIQNSEILNVENRKVSKWYCLTHPEEITFVATEILPECVNILENLMASIAEFFVIHDYEKEFVAFVERYPTSVQHPNNNFFHWISSSTCYHKLPYWTFVTEILHLRPTFTNDRSIWKKSDDERNLNDFFFNMIDSSVSTLQYFLYHPEDKLFFECVWDKVLEMYPTILATHASVDGKPVLYYVLGQQPLRFVQWFVERYCSQHPEFLNANLFYTDQYERTRYYPILAPFVNIGSSQEEKLEALAVVNYLFSTGLLDTNDNVLETIMELIVQKFLFSAMNPQQHPYILALFVYECFCGNQKSLKLVEKAIGFHIKRSGLADQRNLFRITAFLKQWAFLRTLWNEWNSVMKIVQVLKTTDVNNINEEEYMERMMIEIKSVDILENIVARQIEVHMNEFWLNENMVKTITTTTTTTDHIPCVNSLVMPPSRLYIFPDKSGVVDRKRIPCSVDYPSIRQWAFAMRGSYTS